MRMMICARREIADWLEIAAELVCDHNARVAKLGDKPLQETSCSFRVSLWLNENVEHSSVCVDRPPKPVFQTVDRQHHLVEMPLVCRCRPIPSDSVGKMGPKPVLP